MRKHVLCVLLGLFLLGMPMGSATGAPYVYEFYDTDATSAVPEADYLVPTGGEFALDSQGAAWPPFFQVLDMSGSGLPLPLASYVHQSRDDAPTSLRVGFTFPSQVESYAWSFDFALSNNPDLDGFQPLTVALYAVDDTLLWEREFLPTSSYFDYMDERFYVGSTDLLALPVGFDGYAVVDTGNDYGDGKASYLWLDNLSYTPVPIPGTLGLLGIGLLGLGNRMRRGS